MRSIFIFFLCFILFWVKESKAEQVIITTAKNPDFARIVFQWKRPVRHTFLLQDRTIKLRFGRKIEAQFQLPSKKLPGYISSVKPEADGKGLVFELNSNFDAYSYNAGSAIIVEIEGDPIELKKPVSNTLQSKETKSNKRKNIDRKIIDPSKNGAKSKEKVRLRFAEHSNYTRIVFDWPQTVKYSFNKKGGGVFIQFEKAADLEVSRLKRKPPRLVGEVKTIDSEQSALIAFAVPKTSKVRHFLSGSKVVIDVLEPSGSEKIDKLPLDLLPTQTPATQVDSKKKKIKGAQKKIGEKVQEVADKKSKGDEKESSGLKEVEKGSSFQKPINKKENNLGEKNNSDPKRVRTDLAGEDLQSTPLPQPLVSTKSDQRVSNETGKIEDAVISIKKIEGVNGGMALRFDWPRPVGAAVFRRTGALWLSFDERSIVDTNKILGIIPLPEGADPESATPSSDPENAPPPKPSLQGLINSVDQMVATSGTVLRIKTKKGINPALTKDGNSWVLTFSRRQLKPNNLIEVKAQPKPPEGPRIFLPIEKAGKPLGVTDPETGSNLVIVPVIPLSHGVARDFIYPEVEVLKTGQGILIVPSIDSLKVQSTTKGVIIKSSAQINISSVSGELLAAVKEGVPGELTAELELEQWSTPAGIEFQNRKEKLFRSIALAKKPADLKRARLDLARFYFSNSYASEAIAVLNMLKLKDPDSSKTPEFNLLLAGSNFLLGRYNQSAKFLRGSELDKIDEAAFWRAATISKSGKMVAGAYEMQRTGELVKTYPKPIRMPLSLLIADAAVTIGQLKPAKDMLKSLKKLEPSEKEKSEIFYLEGRLAEADGKREEAIGKWEQALSIGDRPIFVRASAARIENLMRLEKINANDAIRELEKLRYLWRGDEFEFQLLRRLGNLYLNQKGYQRGLKTLRQAVTYFSKHKDANSVTEEMTDTFNFLFLKDGADALAPVSAIALFQDFQELTPAGEEGNEMIRKLADRLVAVDLLEQAAMLLDDQVRTRLKGVEKGEVGMNLAIIYAFDKRYKDMVSVLDSTKVAGLSESTATRRRHLRAHALGNLNRIKEALLLLKGDRTVDADLVRAEMFWGNRDWSNAAQSLMSAIRGAGLKAGQKLDDVQAVTILNLATAYTLSNNEKALMRLRRDYGVSMAATNFNDAFQLVAAPQSLGLISPGSVSKRVEMVTNFRSFLEKYKMQIQDRKLSAITRVGKIVGKMKAI